MIKTITTQVKGCEITFTTFTAPKGYDILKKIIKYVDGGFNTTPVIHNIVMEIVSDEGVDDGFIKYIIEDVKIDGQLKDFDSFFSGNYKLLFNIVLEVLNSNYSKFLQTKRFSIDSRSSEEHPVTRKIKDRSELNLILWRPILSSNVATWTEVNTLWDINDLFDCLEALDIQQAYEKFEYDKASKSK